MADEGSVNRCSFRTVSGESAKSAALHRVGIGGHGEPRDGKLLITQTIGKPGEETPVVESLETVNEDDECPGVTRHIENATDRRVVVGVDRESHQTLKRKRITSPSCTTYSFPSLRIFPAARAACSLPPLT